MFVNGKQQTSGDVRRRKRFSPRRMNITIRVIHQLPFYCGRHSERSVVPGEPKINTENGQYSSFVAE